MGRHSQCRWAVGRRKRSHGAMPGQERVGGTCLPQPSGRQVGRAPNPFSYAGINSCGVLPRSSSTSSSHDGCICMVPPSQFVGVSCLRVLGCCALRSSIPRFLLLPTASQPAGQPLTFSPPPPPPGLPCPGPARKLRGEAQIFFHPARERPREKLRRLCRLLTEHEIRRIDFRDLWLH